MWSLSDQGCSFALEAVREPANLPLSVQQVISVGMSYLSASVVVIHYKDALYQVSCPFHCPLAYSSENTVYVRLNIKTRLN